MIKETLKYIEEQTGLILIPCNHFKGVKEHNNRKYFNVVLKERTSESEEFNILQRFCVKYKTIEIEPNGLKRIVIFKL